MFQLEMLPAREGDCLVLSWGDPTEPFRLIIDAGRDSTADAVQSYTARHGRTNGMFELFIVTHIDRDHIEGAVKLLRDEIFRPLVKEVWFNDRGNLTYAPPASDFEEYGALDGERLATLISKHAINTNMQFKPAPVAVEGEWLRTITLQGGLQLTVLSPDHQQLANLAKPWDDTVREAPDGWEEYGEPESIDIDFLASRPFKSDRAKPNGSSIAVVASYRGSSVLLTGDAHVERLLASLELYSKQNPQHERFTLVKASHHGSRGNVSLSLVKAVKCEMWAISTNGDHFKHPDREAIARIIAGSPNPVQLFFNYDTEFTKFWRKQSKQPYVFTSTYGTSGYLAIAIPQTVSRYKI